LENHFILTAAGLGGQLLRTYDIGRDVNGNLLELTPERIDGFLNDILHGRTAVANLSGTLKLADFAGRTRAIAAAVA
jgi:hypothetical protein